MYANCFLICFDSVFFTNQVTNILTEVVPFCKSGHIYIYIYKKLCVISIKTLVTIVSSIQCKPNTILPQTKPVYLNMYKAVKITFERGHKQEIDTISTELISILVTIIVTGEKTAMISELTKNTKSCAKRRTSSLKSPLR